MNTTTSNASFTGKDGAEPSKVSRPQRRAAIVEAAREHFVAHGYYGTAMTDIAAEVGVTKPIVYQYFSSKKQLYITVLEAAAEELKSIINEALTQPVNNRDIVIATVAAYFNFVADDKQWYRLLLNSSTVNDDDVHHLVAQITTMCVDVIATTVHQHTAMSVSRSRLLANAVVGASDYAAREWWEQNHAGLSADVDEQLSKEEAVALTVQSVWAGLRSVPVQTAAHAD